MNRNLIFVIFACLNFSLNLFPIDQALASTQKTVPAYRIRQEHSHTDGVLVSRPNQADLKVKGIILASRIQSIEDYAQWLKENITYRKDTGNDNWASPEQMLILKSGDCEDFSWLSYAFLNVLGYHPQFLVVRRQNDFHAICIFKKDGQYLWFDNATLKKSPTASLPEFLQYLTVKYQYSSFYEVDQTTNQWSLVYKKS